MCEKPKDTSSTETSVISVSLLILNSQRALEVQPKGKKGHIRFIFACFNLNVSMTIFLWLWNQHIAQFGLPLHVGRSALVFRIDVPLLTFHDPQVGCFLAYRFHSQSNTLHMISVPILMSSAKIPVGNHFKCRIYSIHPHLVCQLVHLWLAAFRDQDSKMCT